MSSFWTQKLQDSHKEQHNFGLVNFDNGSFGNFVKFNSRFKGMEQETDNKKKRGKQYLSAYTESCDTAKIFCPAT